MAEKMLVMEPVGWPTTINDCEPGFFVWVTDKGERHLGFKTEYRHEGGGPEWFNQAGEYGHFDDAPQVQSVEPKWIDDPSFE